MGSRTGNPAWQDSPSTATPITAARLEAIESAIDGSAPLASPVFTGDPKAPTPATGDNDTSVATTAFVKAQGYAPLASPALTGNPTAPTQTAGNDSTRLATTAFVQAAVAAAGGGGGVAPTLIPKPGSFITSVFTDANGGAGPLGLATGAVGGARFFFGAGFDVAALMIRLQTGEASTSVKILLYDSDANGYPKNLVVNSGSIDVSSGTFKTATFSPVSIDAGTYWGFVRSNSPGGTLRIWGVKQQGVPQVYPSTNQGPSTSGGTIKADVGTYASPTATLTSWDESAPGNFDTVPYILVGRAS